MAADVLLLAAAANRDAARGVAARLEGAGWSVDWGAGDPAAAGCVVVLWSRASRYDFEVGLAAGAAQRAGRLLGVTLDGTRPPYGYPPAEGTTDEVVPIVAAALRLGRRAYHLPVRARLLAEVWARLHALRDDRIGRLWAAVEQVRRRRAAPGAPPREGWWRRLLGR